MRTYQQIDDALNALEAGQVDAVIHDFAITKFAERSRKALVVVQAIPTGEQYGLAFAKGRTGLRHAVNTALDQMKTDGTYARIYRKWLRSDPPQQHPEHEQLNRRRFAALTLRQRSRRPQPRHDVDRTIAARISAAPVQATPDRRSSCSR